MYKRRRHQRNGLQMATELNMNFFFVIFFFNAQAVLFLCTTSNLNLLCKDGYVFVSLLPLSETHLLVVRLITCDVQ